MTTRFHDDFYMTQAITSFPENYCDRVMDHAYIPPDDEGHDNDEEGTYDPNLIADPVAFLREDMGELDRFADGLYEELITTVDDYDWCTYSPEQAQEFVEMVDIYREIMRQAEAVMVGMPTIEGQRRFLCKLYVDVLSPGELPRMADLKALSAAVA